jgi:hypothetical protein
VEAPIAKLLERVTLVLVLVAITGAAPAWAANCTESTRAETVYTTAVGSAVTTVKNEMTGQALQVQIFRDGTEKLNESVLPGKQAQFKAGLGGTATKAKIDVAVTPGNGKQTGACGFVVTRGGSGGTATWKVPKDATSVCPNATTLDIACEKTWHGGKNQFHTIFTVSDL